MTGQEVIEHWRKGARSSLKMAHLALSADEYEHALFHCHLAIEKTLKALYMEQHGEDHPYTHDLRHLAGLIQHALNADDMNALQEMTEFVTDARYSDPYWAAEEATKENAAHWIRRTEHILSALLPS
ncbi:MAG: HEPN domain-containing protein [Candidatus Peregrinibacteria bacterium]